MRSRSVAASLAGAAALLLPPIAAGAQPTPLSAQIDAVYAVQQREEAAAAAVRKQAADKQKATEATARHKEALAAARARRQESEERADRKRDRDYLDQRRSIFLQQEELELAEKRAHVARVNEFINRDLAHQDAETDVLKSDAEATRNLSMGAKTFLDDEGTAEIRRTAQPVH